MPGTSMDSAVNPNVAGNPAYNLNDIVGTNQVVLQTPEIPSHIHTGTVSAPTPSTHTHQMLVKPGVMGQGGATSYQDYSNPGGRGEGGRRTMDSGVAGNGSYESAFTEAEGNHSHTITIDPTGGGLGHNNYQPGIGAYYIIYIP
jgi:microcystin-dependent protein